MTRWTWAKMPSAWIRDQGRLTGFLIRDLGGVVTALKLYLALAGQAGMPKGKTPGDGRVSLTYDELGSVADISRGMISAGLHRLHGLVEVHRQGGRAANLYSMVGFPKAPTEGWAKLPAGHILHYRKLRGFSSRSKADFAALKLYLVLLAFRENTSNQATISYDKIENYTGLRRQLISLGVSKLLDSGLVSVSRGSDDYLGLAGPACNRYRILGLR